MAEIEGEIGDVLWFCTDRWIGGIDLRNVPVVKEVVDWESVSPLTFDFSLDLVDTNIPVCMDHFVLDSKIYLAGGLERDFDPRFRSSFSPEGASYGIYEFDFDQNTKQPLLSVADSFRELPDPETLDESFIANFNGDVYFIKTSKSVRLVLDSEHRRWEDLPRLYYTDRDTGFNRFFILHDKVFAECFNRRTQARAKIQPIIFSFDPKTTIWKEEPYEESYNNIFYTFKFVIDGGEEFLFPDIAVAVPGFSNDNNCSIMLTSSSYMTGDEIDPAQSNQYRARIYALMVNQKGLVHYQPLDECFEGIQPIYGCPADLLFVDIGNGKVCALVLGSANECAGASLLCISLFSLARSELDTHNETDNPRNEQKFLSINILNKNVFIVNEEDKDFNHCMNQLNAFAWSPPKNTKMSRKRKEIIQ